MEISEAIWTLTGLNKMDQVNIIACTVKSVNISARSCVVTTITNGAETDIPDVMLMAELDDGVMLIPSVNSTVFITYSRYCQPYISLFSACDKVIMFGGDLGGMVKVNTLLVKLNNLENAYNDLAAKFNSHTHILTLSTGTGTAAPTTTTETTTLTLTQKSDIENPKVLHGS